MRLIIGLCSILVVAVAVHAAKTVNISGTVKDGKGAAIAGATVNLASDTLLRDTTNSSGEFIISNALAIKSSTTSDISVQKTDNIDIKGNQLQFSVTSPTSNGIVTIFSINGKRRVEISVGKMESGVCKYTLPELTPGYYILHIMIDQFTTICKLVATENEFLLSNNISGRGSTATIFGNVAAGSVNDTLIVSKEGFPTLKKAITSYIQTGITMVMEQADTSSDNLFAKVLKKTDAEIDAKLDSGFKSLFHGGSNQTIYYEGGPGAYILDVNNGDVRSEGMSYGMMICVQMDKKEEFNKLWKWAKQVMGGGRAGTFGWQANSNGSLRSSGSAPDGEEYFATALIFAGKRWNDNTLLNEGKSVCGATKSFFSQNLVQFVAGAGYTDPSYILPAFYEVWATVDAANSSFWKTAASTGRNFFHKTCNANTMLAPAMANFDGSPNSSEGYFESDAWRVVGNIMMDWHFFHVDPWQQSTFAPKFAAFWKTHQAKDPMPDEFDLNGTVRTSHTPPAKGLIAENALLGFALPAADAEFFVKALWDLPIPTGNYRYYDGCLYMLTLLHVSGKFKLYY
jgi:oligosaccharide reducing-end xylanase